MDTANNTYPALQFSAPELSAFAVAVDLFIISLKNGNLIHFVPDNTDNFYHWLITHNIRDIANEKTKKEEMPVINKGTGLKGLFKQQK